MNENTTVVQIPPTAAGMTLHTYLAEAGIVLAAPCGGRGICGKCRIQVRKGCFYSNNWETNPGEKTLLKPDADGYILACQAICHPNGAEIGVPRFLGDGLTTIRIEKMTPETELAQTQLAGSLSKHSHFAKHPAFSSKDRCQSDGIALDIGTTTIAAAWVHGETGRIRASASCINPQQAYGADILTRIDAANNGMLSVMQLCVIHAVRALIEKLPIDSETVPNLSLVVSGNATMLHLFCGVSPAGMGVYPFTPVFTQIRIFPGDALSLPVRSVTLLPSASAFVGSDIAAGMLYCHLGQSNPPTLLLDIGTNGEMVLDTGRLNGNRLLATSTAAGPALEGATLSCGMGGVSGAVSRVGIENGRLVYETIGDASARGICGCGLMDLCAYLLDMERIDETGYLDEDPYTLSGIHKTAAGYSAVGPTSVSLTQKDVRALQLAKSAIRAGMEALLDAAGMDVQSFVSADGRVFIAGGLGYYLSPVSAARIGMLPQTMVNKPECVVSVGNSALAGAAAVCADPTAIEHISRLAHICETIELNRSAYFHKGFIEHMLFPHLPNA